MDKLIREAGERPVEPEAADLELLLEAVCMAGRKALSFYGAAPDIQHKSDGTLVSEADLAVDAALQEALLGARPDYGWISEESRNRKPAASSLPTWIVDPIDGTRAFLKEIPDWTISVGLLRANAPVLAAVFNPVHDELFEARLSHGARLNGDPIAVSDRQKLAGARLAATKSMLERDHWRQPWPPYERVWVKSIAYRLALAAAGRYDAVIFHMGHDWDIAAAQLLVEEAGGLVTNSGGARLLYDGSAKRQATMLAAGPALHGQILDRVIA